MHNPDWNVVLLGSAAVVAVGAGWLDWRTRRIPNRVTIPALVVGLGTNALASGWSGIVMSLEGAGLALGLLLPFVLVRGMGAGDWKLMGALGAFLGPRALVIVLLEAIFIGGIMAVVEMVRSNRVKETLRNVWTLLLIAMTFGYRGARDARGHISLDNPEKLAVPFGVATALSMVVFVCWKWVFVIGS